MGTLPRSTSSGRARSEANSAQTISTALVFGGPRLMAKINLLPWRVERSEHRAQTNSAGPTLGGLD